MPTPAREELIRSLSNGNDLARFILIIDQAVRLNPALIEKIVDAAAKDAARRGYPGAAVTLLTTREEIGALIADPLPEEFMIMLSILPSAIVAAALARNSDSAQAIKVAVLLSAVQDNFELAVEIADAAIGVEANKAFDL